MNLQILKNINAILERDSTSTTYKFALLRGVIEIVQDDSAYVKRYADYVEIPFYLIMEKWLLYYYGIFKEKRPVPQINGNAKLAFEAELIGFINAFDDIGGFRAFYTDIRKGSVSNELTDVALKLLRKLRATIYNMPMKHIGFSVYKKEYSIFSKSSEAKVKLATNAKLSLANMIAAFGCFRVDRSYYEAFEMFGHFIIGTSGIINRWSDFSVNASKGEVSKEQALARLTDVLLIKRFTDDARCLIVKGAQLKCVWSRKEWESDNLEIDHILPFSVYRSNDLWNLVPSIRSVNNNKRDKIPSEKRFVKSKDLIIHCWENYYNLEAERFRNEATATLMNTFDASNWQNEMFAALVRKSEFLIEKRGLQIWG